MQEDKKLKEILVTGAEIASANFTDTTMKRIHTVKLATFYQQPLVSNRMKNIFYFIFSGLVFLMLLFYLFGSPAYHMPDGIRMYPLSVYTSYRVVAFLILFWFVFIVNNYLQSIKFRQQFR